jgi:signal transduction histidine kinase
MPAKEIPLYYSFLAGLSTLLLMCIFFFISMMRHHKRRIVEMKNQTRRDIRLIEEERKRIAADLHDDMGSSLASIRRDLIDLEEVYPDNKRILKTADYLDDCRKRLRAIAYGLMPSILLDKGLCAALSDLFEVRSEHSGLQIQFNNDCNDSMFQEEANLLVYRVMQEILSNTIRHAKARHFIVLCSRQDKWLEITTKDDGIGFSSRKSDNGGGMGLTNIAYRLELLKADYTIISEMGKGTIYKIRIPLYEMMRSV